MEITRSSVNMQPLSLYILQIFRCLCSQVSYTVVVFCCPLSSKMKEVPIYYTTIKSPDKKKEIEWQKSVRICAPEKGEHLLEHMGHASGQFYSHIHWIRTDHGKLGLLRVRHPPCHSSSQIQCSGQSPLVRITCHINARVFNLKVRCEPFFPSSQDGWLGTVKHVNEKTRKRNEKETILALGLDHKHKNRQMWTFILIQNQNIHRLVKHVPIEECYLSSYYL